MKQNKNKKTKQVYRSSIKSKIIHSYMHNLCEQSCLHQSLRHSLVFRIPMVLAMVWPCKRKVS